MKISNIKAHFLVNNKRISAYSSTLKQEGLIENSGAVSPSFIVLRRKHFVFTCFFSGFINVTGVKNFEQLKKSVKCLAKCLHMRKKYFQNPIVDSISSSYPNPSLVPKQNVSHVIKEAYSFSCVRSIKYNRERFPAAFIKTNYGTVLWFGTPSIVVVGSKSKLDLLYVKHFIDGVIKNAAK